MPRNPRDPFKPRPAAPPPEVEGLPPTSDVQTCRTCGFEKMVSEFHSDGKGGHRLDCKECRGVLDERKTHQVILERVEKLDRATLNLLDEYAKNAENLPHMADLTQALIGAFGGLGGFQVHFMAQYLSSKPGSMQRTKMLDLVARLVVKTTELGAAKLPLDLMEDDDVRRIVDERVGHLRLIGHENTAAKTG